MAEQNPWNREQNPEAYNAWEARKQRQQQQEIAAKKAQSINDDFYEKLRTIGNGGSVYGGFEYDPETGELTNKGKRQQQGYFTAKAITGQDVGQSGIDMQKVKKMREDALSAKAVDADLAARSTGDKIGKLQQKAGMSGIDVAGMVADSARRGQLEAAAINQRAQQTALDKFAQNVASMAGINLSTIQAYENMGTAEEPVPTIQYDSGGFLSGL